MTFAPPTWRSTTSIRQIADWLSGASSVVVLTHTKPDGDALGSTLALVRTLRIVARRRGGRAEDIIAWYTGPMPVWTSQIADPGESGHTDQGQPPEAEAVVICDTGAWTQLEGLSDYVKARRDRIAIIDHHLEGATDVGRFMHVETSAAAACVPVAELCCLLLGVASAKDLPREVAEPLFFGCATDTGWFRFSNANPQVLRLAADLLEAGVDQPMLYRISEQQNRAARIYIMGRALSGMKLFHNDRLAIATVTLDDIGQTESAPGDTGGFADTMLGVATVEVAAILTEMRSEGRPMVKISLRSKPGPHAVDVNELSKIFGGGGHARAGGAKVKGTLDEVTFRLVQEARGFLA